MANIKEITASGKTIIEAQENARAAIGAGPLDDVNFELLDAGSKGILGIIGVRPAKVRAWIELPEPEERHHRKSEKPRRERPDGEKNERPQGNKKKHNKPKKNDSEKAAQKPEKAPKEKEKSAVIPEADLKLEPKAVSEGEDMSFDFVKTLIKDIALDADAALYTCEDGTRRIVISGEDASVLIGHHGDTLDALQYLANLASARKNIHGERDKSRVTVDIEGYRAKREETLRALARRMANKALTKGRSVMLEPMSAYERRIIHSEIQGIEGVSTNSVGQDSNRKIVIYLTDKKPKELFEEEAKDVKEEVNAIDETAFGEAAEVKDAADSSEPKEEVSEDN